MFTAYGTAKHYPELFSALEQAADTEQWKKTFSRLSDFEHQSTMFPPAPFALVFLVRMLQKRLEDGTADEIVKTMLDQFAYYIELCVDAERAEHVQPPEHFWDLLDDQNLLPEGYTEDDLLNVFEDPDAISAELFYSFYYYSMLVLSQVPDMLDSAGKFPEASRRIREKASPAAGKPYESRGVLASGAEDGHGSGHARTPAPSEPGLKLIRPSMEYDEAIQAYRREFLETGDSMDGGGSLRKFDRTQDWLDRVAAYERVETMPRPWVPTSQYIYIREADSKMVGVLQIRHYFNEYLEKYGGHIGYSVAPSERRKGYATQMLRLALPECAKRGLDRVLITCVQGNEGSRRTILNNGGVFESTVFDPEDDCLLERYWIDLTK